MRPAATFYAAPEAFSFSYIFLKLRKDSKNTTKYTFSAFHSGMQLRAEGVERFDGPGIQPGASNYPNM